MDDSDWETNCPKREDGMHCNCWYDGGKCCACGDPASEEPEAERRERRTEAEIEAEYAAQNAFTDSVFGEVKNG